MSAGTFAAHLSGLDEPALTALLEARPDVLVEPVPRGFTQLAQRLDGADSLVAALRALDRDAVVVSQAAGALGAGATVAEIARLLAAPQPSVAGAVTTLTARGLLWDDDGVLRLPDRLAAHWTGDIGGAGPLIKIANSARVDDLRAAAAGLGHPAPAELRKPALIQHLAAAMADPRALVAVITQLPKPARERLRATRGSEFDYYYYPGYGGRGAADPTIKLVDAGLMLLSSGRPVLPREVAVAAWLADDQPTLTGRPDLPPAVAGDDVVGPAARAAAQEALRSVTALLDEARAKPIAALKKGGIGTRERARLAKRLSIPAGVLTLWIDVAYAAGLLGWLAAGYVPTDAYLSWREEDPAARWAALASGWLGLEHAPTCREVADEREVPPPLPLMSGAGAIRRALLTAAAGAPEGAAGSVRAPASVRAASAAVDWFFPLHGYPPAARTERAEAAVREAELLGVVAADRLSELGGHLLTATGAELARRCGPLLPEDAGGVILQSDLTAVVSGQPSVAVSRLLRAAAVSEASGAAGVWRFTPASVRGALDAGRTAEDLLAELAAVADRPVPQPLTYLINDAARRHGQVKVRGMHSCVIADEALLTEILHTRSLAKLDLSRLAPTVLASPLELFDVIAKLREAGLSPVAEDALGTVIVEARPEHVAPSAHRAAPGRPHPRVSAATLARQLRAGTATQEPTTSITFELLAKLNRRLDEAELELLADAVDHQRDVRITYRDRNGSRTIREIQPRQLYGNWIDSWCRLRDDQRDFTVAGIEAVSPAG